MTQVHPTQRVHLSTQYGWHDGWLNQCANKKCGKEFKSKRWGASFCSDKCRQQFNRDKKRAIALLQTAAFDALDVAKDFGNSQDVYDKMIVLHQCVEKALAGFNPQWVQLSFIPPAPSTAAAGTSTKARTGRKPK